MRIHLNLMEASLSDSRMLQVSLELHPAIVSLQKDFVARNPVLSMGADLRRAALRDARLVLTESAKADIARHKTDNPLFAHLSVDPDNEALFDALRFDRSTAEFTKLMRGWPRTAEEARTYARRVTYASFANQFILQGIHQSTEVGAHRASIDEGTSRWEPWSIAFGRTVRRSTVL